ncbi:MAG: MATE family efflux transporter [Clostridia bacterium]|nr:MATE family efflux transporter [Clostridia bacterium]
MKRDMTTGPVFSTLITFTVPLILGNLLQLMYNAADSVIAGNEIGSAALAAIGAAAPVMNLVVLFISGMCLGTGILVSVEYGSGDSARMERQLSTILLTGAAFSLAVSAVMIPLAGPVIRLTQVEESVLPLARQYLQVIFVGLIFTFLYNFLSSALRALGDSRTPLIFLAVSSVVNVLGDLLLVKALKMGVLGSALATVFSQALSVLLCVLYIKRRIPALCLGKKWLRFDRTLLRSTLGYGFTSAMQQACLQMGKLIIQSQVNAMGVAAAAAFNVVNRVDDFAYTPEQNIAHAMSTFLAQNRGAGKQARVKEGFQKGMILEFSYAAILGLLFFLCAEPIVSLFVGREDALRGEVVEMAVRYVLLISPMYLLPALTNGLQGWFRGMGEMKITLLSTFMNMLGRVLAVVFFASQGYPLSSFAWANLIGWILMIAVELPILLKHRHKQEG